MLKKMRKLLKQQEGFTLVELMIVVVILGILAGIGVQQYNEVQEKAREGVDKANRKMIENAIQLYRLSNNDDGPEDISDLVGYGIEPGMTDPWGDEYYLDISSDETGETTIEIKTRPKTEDTGGTGVTGG
jgi:prepilin-type N-terminal cleavage/methylation domain-containing protein